MNKNPFIPTPSYTVQQPPLPAGPPPAQPTQADYSAYWAAAAQAQQAQAPPAAFGTYNTQWTAPQPVQNPQQSALYANYGYGGQQQQQQQQWQQQQQRPPQQQIQQQQIQQQQYVPAPVIAPLPHAVAPQVQPAYNPYQPQAGATPYQQPYIPQAPAPVPLAPVQHVYQQQQQPMQQAPQPYFPQQPAPGPRPPPQNNLHHTPPQHLPPAKRQRFDRPRDNTQNYNSNRGPLPPQPQFQVPPPPMVPQQQHMGPAGGPPMQGRGGAPGGMMNGARGGAPMGRGMGGVARGGKPNFVNSQRGGVPLSNRGGRGGGIPYNGSATPMGMNVPGYGRGGGPIPSNASLKQQPSRGSFHGNNNGGYANRRGGSFSSGQFPMQQQQGPPSNGQHGSFRGRGGQNQGHFSNGRGAARHDGYNGRDGIGSGPTGLRPHLSYGSVGGAAKKDENKRTGGLTDFKIVGLEIADLDWSWGELPHSRSTAAVPSVAAPDSPVKAESDESVILTSSQATLKDDDTGEQEPKAELDGASVASAAELKAEPPEAKPSADTKGGVVNGSKSETGAGVSRMRIYFHTPVSADDSRPIPHSQMPLFDASSSSRKGKRKKLEEEDDDADLEEGRTRPPPPGEDYDRASVAASADVERGSVAPSVAETMSEGDWLMAAIGGEDSADGDGDAEDASHYEHQPEGDADGAYAEADASEEAQHDGVFDDGVHDESFAEGVPHQEPDAGHPFSSAEYSSAGALSAAPVDEPSSEALAHVDPVADAAADAVALVDDVPEPSSTVPADGVAAPEGVTVDGSDVAPPPSAVSDVPLRPLPSDPVTLEDAVDAAVEGSKPHVTEAISGSAAEPAALRADASFASTVPDFEESTGALDDAVTDADDSAVAASLDEHADATQPTQLVVSDEPSVHAEEPETPSTSTFVSSNSSMATYADTSFASSVRTDVKKTASANRLSISYAGGNRRLVVDAAIVEKLKVFRAEGRIEVRISLDKDDVGGIKGIFIEGLSDDIKSYLPLETLISPDATDKTIPPFSKATMPSQVTLLVYLDTDRPLSEPRWVKSGDVQEWLKSMFGRMFWVAGDAADGWEKRIEVADPDPTPTIWTVLEGWASNSQVGLQTERQRFLKTHMTETDNILEILLRLVRGERATPFSHSTPAISAPSVSGPLFSALSQGSAHGAQQNHVSLAVLAMFRMSVDYAKQAIGEKGKGEAEEKAGEIIRCLPSHLIHKSLDGIFKEWRAEKKGGR